MKAKALRHKPGVMNKGEAAYAQHLEQRKRAGEIVEYLFEPEKLRLADLAFYSPDFFVLLPTEVWSSTKSRVAPPRSAATAPAWMRLGAARTQS